MVVINIMVGKFVAHIRINLDVSLPGQGCLLHDSVCFELPQLAPPGSALVMIALVLVLGLVQSPPQVTGQAPHSPQESSLQSSNRNYRSK